MGVHLVVPQFTLVFVSLLLVVRIGTGQRAEKLCSVVFDANRKYHTALVCGEMFRAWQGCSYWVSQEAR